ncbi:MAG: beta-ketoacyl synthase N-terminal-like domain-containing protein, partial [Betaproteobacteria bacterium]
AEPVMGLPTPPPVGAISLFQPRDYLGEGNFRPLDRTSQLLAAAAELALRDSGCTVEMRQAVEVGLVVGTMFCSVHTISEFDRRALVEGPKFVSPLDFANTVINAAAGQTAIWHGLRGVNSTISAGITSGLQAVAYASDQIRAGHVQAVLAGGVEELCFESLLGFCRAGLICDEAGPRPFATDRNGFALSEGAGLLMLENSESAALRGSTMLAEIKGHGSSFVPSTDSSKDGDFVAGISRAIRLALESAELAAEDINLVSAGANGSKTIDRWEAAALQEVFHLESGGLAVTAIKSLLGESLGASAAWQTIAALESLCDGRVPGIPGLDEHATDVRWAGLHRATRTAPIDNVLINSVGLDGNCCALVLGRIRERSFGDTD